MSHSSGTRYGRSNYANRSFGSKPVETGKEYNIQITETSRKGDGIARIRGYVIFVKGGQIGQRECKGKGYVSRRDSLQQKLLYKNNKRSLINDT
jgi:predicted RNA-binding protein with TRAM domain